MFVEGNLQRLPIVGDHDLLVPFAEIDSNSLLVGRPPGDP